MTITAPVSGENAERPDPLTAIRRFITAHPAKRALYQDARAATDAAARAAAGEAAAGAVAAQAAIAQETVRDRTDLRRRASRLRQLPFLLLLALCDAIACNLAAQVFDENQPSTVLITVLLLVGLLGLETGLDYAARRRSAQEWRWLAAITTGYVVVLGMLRFNYLVTVGGNRLTAALGAGLLTVITAFLVILGYRALRSMEPVELFRARHEARRARRLARRATEEASAAASQRDDLHDSVVRQLRAPLLETVTSEDELSQMESLIRAHLATTFTEDSPEM